MSLDIREGELLAVVGENGAGKSSLMNVLYGLYHPDSGEVSVGGKSVRLKSPRDAIALGIGMVHQHFMLVPTLTVAENVVLGREPTRRGLFDWERAVKEVAATCERFGFVLDPRARVDTLTVGSQQKVEIVKALHRGARVLILDEPTAVLTPQEADELARVMRGLVAQGRTVVLISHKLKEVLGVADRIAVMRRGRLVAEVRPSETSATALAALMVGESQRAVMSNAAATPEEKLASEALLEAVGFPAQGDNARPALRVGEKPPGDVLLEATGLQALGDNGRPALRVGEKPAGDLLLEATGLQALGDNGCPALRGVDLTVREGEIVGIAGVDGNGQRELAEVLTGLRSLTAGSGTLLGRPLKGLTPAEARARGVGHVPEDRLRRAVVKALSVEENIALGRHSGPPFAKGMWIDFAGRRERAQALLAAYDVRPPEPTLPLQALSGGNQQKVVVARELDARPRLLVVVQPTRGLDIGAVTQVHARLREARAQGTGVVLVSLDLEEVLALADRVYVLFEGRVTGQFTRPEYDERELGRRMLGAEQAHG
ncbi:ABC transporter ATP-binding protein [Myxococcus qinghaiensis]|uniref:ABC transporter ATP-binding protein n=1 Tax=Myxococcus qinghaiensis TaxID=2906758 RepID=UPI0020A72BFA|nr:ATP-binding cassette domain-containing protein [Myxococcus qinghaiensis]MCP3162724.1 ABC transporter ATP-binding protein [Myxococcus qinghaiensis]